MSGEQKQISVIDVATSTDEQFESIVVEVDAMT